MRTPEAFALVHGSSGETLATVARADDWWAKGWGVIGWRSLPPGQGLWLPGVSAVHTAFVRFPLDLLFLDDHSRAVRIAVGVPPWTLLVRAAAAHHTIELGAGTLAGAAARAGEIWELKGIPSR